MIILEVTQKRRDILENNLKPNTKPIVQVFVLGQFALKKGNNLFSEEVSRSKKVWELLKCFLLNRRKAMPPEMVLEILWPDQDYTDPHLALRSLVYRLRKLLANDLSAPDLAANIVFSQGCYHWGDQIECWLDVEAFENLYHDASSKQKTDPEAAIDNYRQAISLYQGDFLPEHQYNEWTIPLRNYYHRLYLQCVLELTALLRDKSENKKIIDTCEKALMVEYFEEELHRRYLEALLAEGKYKKAWSHFEEVSSIFSREMGIKPSITLQELHLLLNRQSNKVNPNLTSIKSGLKERQQSEGAFYCQPEQFSYFYRLEKVRQERSEQAACLGLLTIMQTENMMPPGDVLDKAVPLLKEVLVTSLRRGDIVTAWNEAQFLLILPDINEKQGEKVLQRVENKFRQQYLSKNIILNKKLELV